MTKKISAFFTDAGTPKTGLSATIRIRKLSDNSLVVTDAAMTEVGDGFYSYDFTTYDIEEEYTIRCDGSATLTNNLDRYTYAGNESYSEDIWETETTDHLTAGTMGYEIRGAGGVLVGTGAGGTRAITQEEAKAIAQKVWEVMLTNDQSAKDVLLTRSDFDAIKDKVLVDMPDHSEEMMAIHTALKEMMGHMKVMSEKEVTIMVPKSITDGMKNMAVKFMDMEKEMKNMTPEMKEMMHHMMMKMMEEMNVCMSDLADKVTELDDQLAGTNLDLSKANELAQALSVYKESLMSLMTLSVSLNDKMGGSVQQRAMLKKTMIGLTNMKFMSLRK